MNFLLIPGAGGEAWVWSRVEPELSALGHAAVSVDLPVEDATAGIEEYCGRALSAMGGQTSPVVVGLSLGSFTAALVCLEVETASLILVNGMTPLPGETPGEWWDATGQAQAKAANDVREGRDPEAAFDPMTTFFHDVPDDIVREAGQHNRTQSNGPFSSSWALPRWPDVPTHVVIGRDDRFFPAGFQRRLTEERLGIEPDVVAGGHLLPLSRPAALASLLDSYARLGEST
jgi:pimeloyl-ACP methyl ester carboxylesterase